MPLDSVERNGLGAGLVHLNRAADLLDRLTHELGLAEACSDLCAFPGLAERVTALDLGLSLARSLAQGKLEKEGNRKRTTGIRARHLLSSPVYDSLFGLVTDAQGRAVCVMVPGCAGYDPDYWEVVPQDQASPGEGNSPCRVVPISTSGA